MPAHHDDGHAAIVSQSRSARQKGVSLRWHMAGDTKMHAHCAAGVSSDYELCRGNKKVQAAFLFFLDARKFAGQKSRPSQRSSAGLARGNRAGQGFSKIFTIFEREIPAAAQEKCLTLYCKT